MASAPWRCSQCGTINEPVANSCRTCGKWPSLFDLEDSVLEDHEVETLGERDPVPTFEPPAPVETHDAPEPLTVDVETFEETEMPERRRRFEPPPTDPVFEPEGEGQKRPRWVSWIIPIAVVAYIAIQFFLGDR
jgi:hypothetical protein